MNNSPKKSERLAMYIAALMLTIPGIKITIESESARASSNLHSKVKYYLDKLAEKEQVPKCTNDTIIVSK